MLRGDMQGGANDRICAVSVVRDAAAYRISWQEEFSRGPVSISTRDAQAAPHTARLVASDARDGCEVPASSPERQVFRLEPADGDGLDVADRVLAFEGAVNFRDLGGYAAADGRRVRWGALFRSGHMADLTANDRQQFLRLGIGAVCDYRREQERAHENAELPGDPRMETLGIPTGINDPRFFHRLFEQTEDPADIAHALERMMAWLVRDGAHYYQRLFDVLLECPPGAVLMNCSGGKERTGVGAALLLAALGVPRATIMYDFLLTNDCFPALREVPRVREKYGVTLPGERGDALIMPLLVSPPSYLQAAFDAIDEDFASTEAFLASRFGLGPAELARLRDHYLQDL